LNKNGKLERKHPETL